MGLVDFAVGLEDSFLEVLWETFLKEKQIPDINY